MQKEATMNITPDICSMPQTNTMPSGQPKHKVFPDPCRAESPRIGPKAVLSLQAAAPHHMARATENVFSAGQYRHLHCTGPSVPMNAPLPKTGAQETLRAQGVFMRFLVPES